MGPPYALWSAARAAWAGTRHARWMRRDTVAWIAWWVFVGLVVLEIYLLFQGGGLGGPILSTP